MGLSDEERISKLFWGITHITEEIASITKEDMERAYACFDLPEKFDKLRKLSDRLWDTFLGKRSNNTYWLFGGDATEPVTDPKGAWSAAILSLCDQYREVPRERQKDPEVFDPFQIEDLLRLASSGKTLSVIFRVFRWTEAVAYALRRYNDKLAQKHADLSKLISSMQGLCFSIFARNPAYGKAYILNRMCHNLYGGTWTPDAVGKLFLFLHMHHYITRPMSDKVSLTEVIAWDKWRLQHHMDAQNRVLLALQLAGHKFHYEHLFQELVTKAQKLRLKLDIPALRVVFEANQKAHEQLEKKSNKQYRDNQTRSENYAIHGYESTDWKPEPPKKKPVKKKSDKKELVKV